MKIFYLLFILLFIFIPKIVLGEVIINEIMYDLKEGSDSGREWIEIKNIGNEDIDLSDWKLYEDNTNHSLNLFGNGVSFVLSGGYAVIADNAEKFLADWPEFGGVLFDSSFSLKNDGETLIIRDEALSDIDQVSYSKELGASGDGNSLQFINGNWEAKSPTTGYGNSEASVVEEIAGVAKPSSIVALSFPVAPQIYAFSSGDEAGVAGGVLEFKGLALGLKKEPLLNARFLWNFGDGYSKDGKNVTHTYNYPGDYIVFLDVSSGEYSASSRMNVKITESNLKITDVRFDSSGESIVELYNDSDREIDISYWLLRSGNMLFTFPKNSFIGAGSKLPLSSLVTRLNIDESKKADILYPNGSVFYSFDIRAGSSKGNLSQIYEKDILNSGTIGSEDGGLRQAVSSDKITEEVLIKNDDISLNKKQEANAVSFSNESGKSNKWIFFAGGFGLIGVLGVVFAKRIGSVS
ncbi:MAG: lamin tail domain-containing protein [Patescibacteria group bacterium]|nr:lamin tail domain-containing protein [Patescibacteria group bacterium]